MLFMMDTFPIRTKASVRALSLESLKAKKIDIHDGEKRVTEVLLKELDATHKNCWEVTLYIPKYFFLNVFVSYD